jgi:hypothetical protein
LFKEYPWNSTYAFAENDVIRCIDLEGAEKYFTTSGVFLGSLFSDQQIRVVADEDIESFKKYYTSAINSKYESGFKSKSFLQSSNSTQVSIAATIYKSNIGGYLQGISMYNSDPETGANCPSAGKFNLNLAVAKNGTKFMNNYYDMINIFFHEDQHSKDWISKGKAPTDGWTHFNISKAQTQHWSWQNTSADFKDFTRGVMQGYLDEMEMYLDDVYLNENEAKKVNSPFYQQLLKEYNGAVDYYNKTIDQNYEAIDFEKTTNEIFNVE